MSHPIIKLLKETNWKDGIQFVIQLLMDLRVAGSVLFFFFILYFIGYDTVLKPNLETLQGLNESMKTQQDAVEAQKREQQKYALWAKELQGLKVKILHTEADQVSSVLAAGQMGKIEEILSGKKRNASTIEPLPTPHDKLSQIELRQTGFSDITLQGEKKEETPSAEPSAPDKSENEKRPSLQRLGGTGSSMEGQANAEVKLTRYDYEAKVTGTFIALNDVINQLVLQDNVIVIRDIVFSPVPTSNDTPRPDPKTEEHAVIPVTMTLKLSVYIAPNASPGR